MIHTYESDDDNRSDRLEPPTINYEPEDDRPPFYQPPSSSNSDGTKGAIEEETSLERFRKRRPEDKPDTVLGDEVLINYLDQSRRDIAVFERLDPLRSRLQPDDEPGRSTKLKKQTKNVTEPQGNPASSSLSILGEQAKDALTYLDHELQGDKPQLPLQDPKAKGKVEENAAETKPTSPTRRLKSPGVSTSPDDISHLKHFTIPASERLPALQSPPQSAAANSPENRQNLPSIQSAIGELPGVQPKDPSGRVNSASPYAFPPISASSPSAPRNDLAREPHLLGQFPPPQIPLSPYSHLSPASSKDMSNMSSPASQQSCWRPLKSDIHYVTSSYEVSPHSTKSPAINYPTPTDPPTSDRTSFSSNSQPNGAVSTGIFKCHHPGCTAAFQTQYLLNSHAIVHSQDRRHFCPVENCPRAIGGKGFKRKNEMIRHGLVHNSPGYICPFCPEQQRKYPRPDNLQRHVRVHHVDKDKDDPALRAILAQRPEGSVRGRRRRSTPR